MRPVLSSLPFSTPSGKRRPPVVETVGAATAAAAATLVGPRQRRHGDGGVGTGGVVEPAHTVSNDLETTANRLPFENAEKL